MTTVPRKSIRKALEIPLTAAVLAADVVIPGTDPAEPAILWPNTSLKTDELGAYVRFSMHWAPDKVMEMGETPRQESSGMAKITVFTASGTGQDRNDTIAGFIEAAYPYNAALVRDGISVIVDTVDTVDAVLVEGTWWASAVNVNWHVWRAR